MAPRASHRIIRAIHEMVRALIFIYLSLGISFSVRAAPNITLSNGQQQLTFESTSGRWLSLIEETSSQPLVDHAETNGVNLSRHVLLYTLRCYQSGQMQRLSDALRPFSSASPSVDRLGRVCAAPN